MINTKHLTPHHVNFCTPCDIRNTVEQENTPFPVADTIEMDGLDSLNVARCISDHAQAVNSLFSIVTLYHLIYPSVYTDRVSALANIPDRVLFSSNHIMSPLTALHRLIGHVLGLLLKFRPSKFLHRGRRGFPRLWENVLCLNLRIAEISFS